MKYFKFIGDSSDWMWDENPKTNKVYSLKKLTKMYGKELVGKIRISQERLLSDIINFHDEGWIEIKNKKKSIESKIKYLVELGKDDGMKITVDVSPVKDSKPLFDSSFLVTNLEPEKPKDEWEGVEFFKVVKDICNNGKSYYIGQIRKLSLLNDSGRKKWIENKRIEPSTEHAYVKQLKTKSFELYGEIKEGDIFKHDARTFENLCQKIGLTDYIKEFDQLFLKGSLIYEKGIWAKKVEKERVKVECTLSKVIDFVKTRDEYMGINVQFDFKLTGSCEYHMDVMRSFLTSKLEEYLNEKKQ